MMKIKPTRSFSVFALASEPDALVSMSKKPQHVHFSDRDEVKIIAIEPEVAAPVPTKKEKGKERNKSTPTTAPDTTTPVEVGLVFYLSPEVVLNTKVTLVAQSLGAILKPTSLDASVVDVPKLPALRDGDTLIFGANQISVYLLLKIKGGVLLGNVEDALDAEDFVLARFLKGASTSSSSDKAVLATLAAYEVILASTSKTPAAPLSVLQTIYSVTLLELLPKIKALPIYEEIKTAAPKALELAETLGKSKEYTEANKAAPKTKAAPAPVVLQTIEAPTDIPVMEVKETDGIQGMLRAIFTNAIRKAFPLSIPLGLDLAVIARCGNPTNGDYQCNNAMALTKALKSVSNYKGPASPKDTALLIEKAITSNPLVEAVTAAPNGFLNIFIARKAILSTVKKILLEGTKTASTMDPKKVLVDFSSPNIAKEMHVGHLRSTIIGDAVCRILEFCGHDVRRVNHVGDWGTQFGMLITYLQDAYPDILTNPPNISDLTLIYKASKKRFDDEPLFKERARSNVVNLQSGDAACRAIWTLLCDISRKEFQKVYDILGVVLEEVGESYYNPMIPGTIEELRSKGLVIEEEGMLIIKLPHFEIPLIARKSDGGYGYDSTDLSALRYRLKELNRDWVIYVTDEGQASHFHMCFDVAKEVQWASADRQVTRLDHIGFGVVCGDDGKRLKTRSAEGNVRLIDLLEEARSRMYVALEERNKEGKNTMTAEDLDHASRVIGYGAVKYFDLKQHPSTNYIFNFDRMLDTKGDTAVYLLFAYARVTSILCKAEEQKGISLSAIMTSTLQDTDFSKLDLQHPAEKALLFEIFQFGDMIRFVLADLLPNRLCDYLKEISVKFTDFITRCHVLNSKEEGEQAEMTMNSRLLLCEATRRIMETCFQLLGIGTLNRI